MEYGLIELRKFATYEPSNKQTERLSKSIEKHTRETIVILGDDVNENARNIGPSGSSQRPNSAPPLGSGTNLCIHGKSRQSQGQSQGHGPCVQCSTMAKYPSLTQTAGIRSAASLTKSLSFETPLGVVHQSSSSTVEPVRMHSGTSTESFRREISMFKINAMPALEEDANSSDEDVWESAVELCSHYKSKTTDKSKIKNAKHKRRASSKLQKMKPHTETAEPDNANNDGQTNSTNKSNRQRLKQFRNFFRQLFSCSEAENRKELIDSELFIDVSSSRQN